MDNIPFSPSRFDSTHFIKKFLRNLTKEPLDIIDIGCGRLFFLLLLKKLKVKGNYFGIDLKPEFIENRTGSKIKIVKANFLNYPIKKKYDIAACLWVLEHVKNDKQFLQKIKLVIKSKGFFILAVPSFWSWPFEFGRHGYHYYFKKDIIKKIDKKSFKLVKFYESAGFLGFIFMIFYNWTRYLILLVVFPIYQLFFHAKIYKGSWKEFSQTIIRSTLYRYHVSKKGISFHNSLVEKLVQIDNKLKILPSSYIFVFKKS